MAKEIINYSDFEKLDIRVGGVIDVEFNGNIGKTKKPRLRKEIMRLL